MVLKKIVAAGDTLASLEAMRDQLAVDLDECEALRDKAALYLRLSHVLARIDVLRPRRAQDAIDEITARRAARGAGPAKGASRSKRGGTSGA